MARQAGPEPQEPFKRITAAQAWRMLQRSDSVVVDVRQLDEWVQGHVKGAIHIPVDDIINRIDELPTGKNLLFICAQGVRSALACEMAAAMGRLPEKLFNIEDGTPAWIAHKYSTSYHREP